MKPADRAADMVGRYGETCTRSAAARILGKSRGTVARLVKDGMISECCGGKAIDVRSIAAYIATPTPERKETRRINRASTRTRWAV